jgi:hypothetical protein
MLSFVFVVYGAVLIWRAGNPEASWLLPLAGGLFWLLRLVLQLLWFDLRPFASRLVTAAFALAAALHLLAGLS